MGRETLGQVRNGFRDHPVCLGRVGGPFRRSKTGRGTLWDVRDGSGDLRGDPGRVRGPPGRSGMGR